MQLSLVAGEDDSGWPNDGNRFDCFRSDLYPRRESNSRCQIESLVS